MVKINSLVLSLDNSDATYKQGDTVTGKCLVSVDGELNLKHLEIKLFGSAAVNWTESETRAATITPNKLRSGTDRNANDETKKEEKVTVKVTEKKVETVTLKYTSEDQLIRLSYSPVDYEPQTLTDGDYSIPFSFQLLASSLPTSFEGKYGYVRYNVEAVISDLELAENSKTSTSFKISSPALATVDQLKPAISGSEKKKLSSLKCWTKEFIKLKANLENSGQQIGSTAHIKCSIENKSGKTVKPRAILKQTIVYKSGDKEKIEETDISSVEGLAIEPRKTVSEDLLLPIPESVPVLHNQFSLISIKHSIAFQLDIPAAVDINMRLPIIITNEDIPFIDSTTENNNTKL